MGSKYKALFWQLYALAYDAALLLKPYREYLLDILDKMSPEGRILDIGCGTGNLWKEHATAHPQSKVGLTLLDGSDVMLAKAKKKLLRQNPSRKMRFIKFDISKVHKSPFPFEPDSFNQIVMGNALYPLTDPGPLLKEIRRILVEGGTFVVSDPKPDFKLAKLLEGHLKDQKTTFHGGNNMKDGFLMLLKVVIADPKLAPHFPALLFILYCNVLALRKSPTFYTEEKLITVLTDAGFEIQLVTSSYEGQNTLIVAVNQ